jgi:hypothetical protein
MASSAPQGVETAPVSHPSTTQHITPAPTSPAPVQEKHPQSYYGPQPHQQPQNANYFAQYPQSYGQPVQAYAPPAGGAPPPPAGWQPTPQGRIRPEEPKKWRMAFFILHGICVLLAVIDIALSLSLLKWRNNSDIYYSDLTYVALYVVVVPIMCLLWSGAELITRWIRTAHVGITPGAHVGVLLIIWLACGIVGGLLSAVAPWITSDYYDSYRGSSSCYNYTTGYYERCDDDDEDRNDSGVQTRQGIFWAIVAITWLLWAINFTLFVRACVDTHRRRMANRPIIYVPYWAGPGAQGQGWQPLQQNDAQMTQPGQNIPMQTRSHASHVPTPEVASPAPSHQVQEYYTPGTEGVAR